MRFRGIFRFELSHQLRSVWYWLIFLAVLVISFLLTRDGSLAEALRDDFFVNSPFSLAKVTVVGGLFWLVVGAAVAGEAAARDVATGIHPLLYTTPLRKRDYLGGRFLAALALNTLLLLAVPLGAVLAIYASGMDPTTIGPFRPVAYLTNFAFLAFPNAFFGTALQFWLAARSGRPMAAYVGTFLLIFMGFFIASLLLFSSEMGKVLDPIGVHFVLSEMSHLWTSYEKSWRLVTLEGVVLLNRLFWLGVGAAALGLTWLGFGFTHRDERARRGWWRRWRRRSAPPRTAPDEIGRGVAAALRPAVAVPLVRRSFGPATQTRAAMAIAWTSFRSMATSWAGLGMLIAIPLLTIVVILDQTAGAGARLIPATPLVIRELTGPLSDELSRWIFVPFLIAFFAGELIWRERDAGMDEMTDAMPGSDWVKVAGKFLGIGLLLGLFLVLILSAGVAAQALLGHTDFQAGLYLKAVMGGQLAEYLIFVPLALAVHAVVNQKYVGHLAAMMVYVVIVLAPTFGIDHSLFIYGAGPGLSYTAMRGYGPTVGPWLWFKLYWAAWALLLLVGARLFWVRGRESGARVRRLEARRRLGGGTRTVAVLAMALVIALGSFVFYNTNVLNAYHSSDEIEEIRAEYERRYRQYRDAPLPEITGARLRVEISPATGSAEIAGSFRMVNRSGGPIDTLHVTVVPGVETRSLVFDRPATRIPTDDAFPHRIYQLRDPLQPGEELRMEFEVAADPRGFAEDGASLAVTRDATMFDVRGWLPLLGYQADRELTSPADRREHGLPPRPFIPPLSDVETRVDRGPGVVLETVVGTDPDQVAVAPGSLHRSWEAEGRRWFHFVTDGPIGSEWTIASAAYDVREVAWEDVDVRIYHHPGHTRHLDAMTRGIVASLDYYTREIGPYPYGHLTFLEMPAVGTGMHAASSFVTYTEGTTFWHIDEDPATLDFPFAVVAHEMAHQWAIPSAFVEGAPILSESLAWYYAMRVVEATHGPEIHRLLTFMRSPYPYSPIRRGEPLLRGVDPYMAYRKGPFALHALSRYVGVEPVNRALRTVLEEHDGQDTPLATTLDLYAGLQSVTPDSLQYLLHDLFEVNAFWDFEAEGITARQTPDGAWEVTLDVIAEKTVADIRGEVSEVPMDEWIDIGVFARAEPGRPELSAPIYLERHRIRSGRQTITVTVAERPDLVGVDPYHVLDWVENEDDDNIGPARLDGDDG